MQVLAEEAPTVAEYLPATQLMQVLDVLAPRVVECLPMGHSWHTITPVAVEYFPAPQSKHTNAPWIEYVPAAQSMQVLFEEAPTISEYVPVAQATQVSAA